MLRRTMLMLAILLSAACSGGTSGETREEGPVADPPGTSAPDPSVTPVGLVDSDGNELPPAPPVPSGPLDAETTAAIDRLLGSLEIRVDTAAIAELGESGDPRVAWLLSDLLRFIQAGDVADTAVLGFASLTGADIASDPFGSPWKSITDLLIAWDLPAPPDYRAYKERIFTLVDPRWAPFFEDPDSDIDWRLVSWGGVFIDDRPLGDSQPCLRGCIPALDDPAVTDAAGGDWYPDDRIVFALTINGESRAYPKNLMEVHEMVNDTLGGRRIGMPYCTLCGSAQAYLTDSVPDGVTPPVLRTSGLLSRSNKVMYDLESGSVFDTFLGVALSGPLREQGVTLEQATVVTTTWGDWKADHPDTTIVAHDGGIGRTYEDDPLGGRDDNGPIFPVGDVDPRLPVQEPVVGVAAPDGTPVAFPAGAARDALKRGDPVELAGVTLELDAGGLRAATTDGEPLAAHQAFWFAWSQFQPDTLLWEG